MDLAVFIDFLEQPHGRHGSIDGDGNVRQRDSVLGLINGTLHSATYTERDGKVRMITLRKANKREMKRYTQQRNR